MQEPNLYVFYPTDGGLPSGVFSNLEWGKTEALKRAKATSKSQTIYQLVPIHSVEVKITHEYIVSPEKSHDPSP